MDISNSSSYVDRHIACIFDVSFGWQQLTRHNAPSAFNFIAYANSLKKNAFSFV